MFFKKLKYQIDNLMSKGTGVLVISLFGITMIVVLLAGFFAMILDNTEHSFLHSAWKNFMYTLDAGNLSGVEGNAPFLFIALLVTLCGLFFTSILIGIITSGIENKMADLRRGRSVVYEEDHVVVLGYSETTLLILKQLVIAGENQKRQVIVILDDKNKDEMEDEIKQQIPDPKTTRFVCRRGKPDNLIDLQICSIEKSKSIIVVNDDDYYSLKSVLALMKILKKSDNRKVHITTTVNDISNLEAFKIAGDDQIETIIMQDTIARIIAHSCLQPGISAVYTELFNFEGVEIYIESIPEASGLIFYDASLRFQDSTLIGIVRNGIPELNPPSETSITSDDSLILIALDDGLSKLSETPSYIDEKSILTDNLIENAPKQFLVLGCNPLLKDILIEMDKYVSPETKVTIAIPTKLESDKKAIDRLTFENLVLEVVEDKIHDRICLEKLLHPELDNVLVLSNTTVSKNQSDNESMLLLLLLRDISKKKGLEFSITTEIQNAENQELISLESSTDYVVSSFITAMLASQVSQIRTLSMIFDDLLNESGSEIYLKPISNYLKTTEPIEILTATVAASQHNEIFIGYRRKLQSGEYETVLNPKKSEKIQFTSSDRIIVISES